MARSEDERGAVGVRPGSTTRGIRSHGEGAAAGEDGRSRNPASEGGCSGHPTDEGTRSGHLASEDRRSRNPASEDGCSGHPASEGGCGGRLAGEGACSEAVADGAGLNLCARHLVAAYEQVAGEVGVTDALPSPCPACGSRLGVRYPSGWLCAVCEWKYGDIPDPAEAAVVRVDVVYYLRAGERIKIGTSANPRGRLAQLHFDELLAFERGDRHLERRRHEQFAAHRVAGSEWFAVHDELLRHIDEVAAGVGDPFDLYHRWVSEAVALRG